PPWPAPPWGSCASWESWAVVAFDMVVIPVRSCACDWFLESADEVEKGEEVDPDQVDKVPVEADVLDGGVVAGGEVAFGVADEDPGDEGHADDDVEAV